MIWSDRVMAHVFVGFGLVILSDVPIRPLAEKTYIVHGGFCSPFPMACMRTGRLVPQRADICISLVKSSASMLGSQTSQGQTILHSSEFPHVIRGSCTWRAVDDSDSVLVGRSCWAHKMSEPDINFSAPVGNHAVAVAISFHATKDIGHGFPS